jgi:dTDP-4-amino-4,6-dideoxygalactose transaminase
VRVKNGNRRNFQEELKSNGISSGIHYPIALPKLDAYSYLEKGEAEFSEAIQASNEIVSLPIFPELSEKQIIYISDIIKRYNQS